MSLSAINTSTTTEYENTQPGDTISTQATFQSSIDYSLLQTTTKPNGETTVTQEGWYT
jgi:hypothetical protein